MKHPLTESTQNEVYQQMIAALEQARAEGQPVQAIYEAIQAGKDVQIRLEPASAGKMRLIISV